MRVSFNLSQAKRAREDVIRVYEIAEERLKKSCIWIDEESCRNAFQVFRYAFREWALRESRGVVLRALMVADKRVREVSSNSTEMVIQCADPELGEALARLLERDGYEESTDCR